MIWENNNSNKRINQFEERDRDRDKKVSYRYTDERRY